MAPTPTEMEHQVGWNALAPTFHTALGIERVLSAAQLMENVEGLEAYCNRFFLERLGKRGVADEIICVHRLAVVATATVHLGICSQLKFPRQTVVECKAVVVLNYVECAEVSAVAHAVAVGEIASGRDVEVIDAVVETQVFCIV